MIEKITEQERIVLDSYVRNWAGRAVQGELAPLEHRLRFWERDKQNLFKLMGGELILEKTVQYERDRESLADELYDEMNSNARNFYRDLIDYFYDKAMREEDGNWKWIWMNGMASYLTSTGALCDNSWPRHYGSIKFPLPNGKTFTVNPGTKITRILGKLANAYGIEGWDDLRETHAKISTFKRTTGRLCLSIHPMDFYTLSDNDEGWNSCMNWTCEDDDDDYGGSYRAGTVEMMNSPYIVVAYLKSDHEFEGWNSKVWRELMIVDKNVITNIKGYPMTNDFLTKEALTWLRELAQKNMGWEYVDELMTYNSRYSNGNVYKDSMYISDHSINFDFDCNHMYNDTCRQHAFAFVNSFLTGTYRLNYSGVMNCQVCGGDESDVYFESDNRVACDRCNPIRIICCDECGEYIYDIDESYTIDGHTICSNCYETETCFPDNDPDEPHLISQCKSICIVDLPKSIDKNHTMDGDYRVNLWEYWAYIEGYVKKLDKITVYCAESAIPFKYATELMLAQSGLKDDYPDEVQEALEQIAKEEENLREQARIRAETILYSLEKTALDICCDDGIKADAVPFEECHGFAFTSDQNITNHKNLQSMCECLNKQMLLYN